MNYNFFFLISSIKAVSMRLATVLFSFSAIFCSGLITVSSSSLTGYTFFAIGYLLCRYSASSSCLIFEYSGSRFNKNSHGQNMILLSCLPSLPGRLYISAIKSLILLPSSKVAIWPMQSLASSSGWNDSPLLYRSVKKVFDSSIVLMLSGIFVFIIICFCITNVIRLFDTTKLFYKYFNK